MAKKRRTKRASYWGMAAKTTSKDWGFGPVSGKGGKNQNSEIGDGMIHREQKELDRN